MLGDHLQLFAQHLGQARQAALAQLLADLRGQALAMFAALRLLAALAQVADVEQL